MEHKEHNDQDKVPSMMTSALTRKEWHKPELKMLQVSGTLAGEPFTTETTVTIMGMTRFFSARS